MRKMWDVQRIADESCLDDLVAINEEAFTHPWTREMFLDELREPDRSFLLAVFSGDLKVIGYCSVWKVVDDLQVNSIAVAKSYRGRGIGVALLNAVVTLGCELGAVSVFLEVRSSNTVARELYRRLAFNETGYRTDYYSQPIEDAVILCRRLESPRPV